MDRAITILGVPFHSVTLSQARDRVLSTLHRGGPPLCVYSINPEIIMAARKHGDLEKALLQGDLNIPDGIGVVWGSRIVGHTIPERVAGFDLLSSLLQQEGLRVFLLGGEKGVGEEAAIAMRRLYPGIRITGIQHGFFSSEDLSHVLKQIQEAKPQLLLVAMGFPRQELFIHSYSRELEIPVSMAVGGSLDVLAGRSGRAPVFIQKIGMEWLYRLMANPRRWKRALALPAFVLAILGERWRGGKG